MAAMRFSLGWRRMFYLVQAPFETRCTNLVGMFQGSSHSSATTTSS